eukprot:scaffold261956_cov22-Tisochrysis_lutea.AAC.1
MPPIVMPPIAMPPLASTAASSIPPCVLVCHPCQRPQAFISSDLYMYASLCTDRRIIHPSMHIFVAFLGIYCRPSGPPMRTRMLPLACSTPPWLSRP